MLHYEKQCYSNEESAPESGGPSDCNKPEGKETKTPLRSPALDAVQKLISLTPTSGTLSTPSTPKTATVSNLICVLCPYNYFSYICAF